MKNREFPFPVLIDVNETQKVAALLNHDGVEIASIPFDTFEEVCSREFYEYMLDVASTVAVNERNSTVPAYENSKGPEPHFGNEVFQTIVKDGNDIDRSLDTEDWKDIELALAQVEEANIAAMDADFALAMALQEQEESETIVSSNASSRYPNSSEFPSLPKIQRTCDYGMKSMNRINTVQKEKRISSIEEVSPRTLIAITSSEDFPLEDMGYRKTLRHHAHNVFDERHDFPDLKENIERYLSSTHSGPGEGTFVSDSSRQTMERLCNSPAPCMNEKGMGMENVRKQRIKSNISNASETKTNGKIMSVGRENEIRSCKKKFRKIVQDMVSTGWYPLKGRGGGHYMYERIVTRANMRTINGKKQLKQLLILPSTPSDIRAIDVVKSRIRRLDREAADFIAR